MENLKVIPTGQALGAEIFGLDLTRPLSRPSINGLREALLDYSLIFFRNQSLSEQNQVNFTRYFGKPVEHVRKQLDRPIKEIFLISNIKKEGKKFRQDQSFQNRYLLTLNPFGFLKKIKS